MGPKALRSGTPAPFTASLDGLGADQSLEILNPRELRSSYTPGRSIRSGHRICEGDSVSVTSCDQATDRFTAIGRASRAHPGKFAKLRGRLGRFGDVWEATVL